VAALARFLAGGFAEGAAIDGSEATEPRLQSRLQLSDRHFVRGCNRSGRFALLAQGRSGYAGAAFQSELIFNGGVAERRPLPISASSN
jgi:hypothetical protein